MWYFRCPTDYELVGNQIVECNYQNGHFEWSSDIPVCEFAGILSTETPTASSTEEIPDDVGSPDGETGQGTGSENADEKGECEGSIALECWSKLQVRIEIYFLCIKCKKNSSDDYWSSYWRNNNHYNYCCNCCLHYEKEK